MKEYESTLTPELRSIYLKIVNERQGLSTQGYVIGFLISILFVAYNTVIRKMPLTLLPNLCIVIFISYIVSHLYYMIMPKTDNMLRHLTKKEEIDAWLKMYNFMKTQFHLSFAVGMLAVLIYFISFC
jgi:uncharacterized protein YacL